jgi:ABC-type branched-subunit amino acid transport system substrate-binding protein
VTYRSRNGGRSCEVALQSTGRAPQTRWIAPGLPSNRITTIAFAPDGVWIGTARGLAHGTGLTSWETLPPTGGDQQTVEKISRSAAGENDSTRAHLQPSREKASPAAIAVLGPYNRTISLPGERPGSARRGGRADLLAVQLAIEHINTIRRTRGQEPFELAVRYPGYAEYGWGTPEDEFARTAANDNVLGIVGFLRPDNSIAEAVVTHTDIPVVNAAPSPREKGGVQTANPWIFRCWGDLPRQHRLLLDHVFDRLGHTRIAALHTPDEDAQRHLAWWRSHAGSRGHPLVGEVSYDGTSQGLAEALEALRSWEPDVVLTWCDADTSAAILQQMRRMRMNQLLIGGPQIVTDEFVTQVQTGLPAGTTPGSVIALYPTIRADTARPPSTFITQYAERGLGGPAASVSGTALEQWHGAYRSFDAANHLLEAIDLSSANREAVRRTLRMMRESATGEHHYERLHPRTQLTFARLEAGAWVFQAIDPPK